MKHFRLQCTLRVLLIGATMLAALLLLVEGSYLAAALVAAAAAFALRGLVVYVERTNRELARFLRSVRYADFSQTFTGGGHRGDSFEELAAAFREVVEDFRAARAETEEHYRYLHTILHHIGIGLLSFRQDGTVDLINTAAKRLLRVTHLKNIRALSGLSEELVGVLTRLRSGEKALVKVVEDDHLLQLSVYATEFRMRDELYKLVSMQDIGSELEEQEIESWQKLTRVLTHEIMNSITPIASLAATIGDLLEEVAAPSPPGDDAAGTVSAEAVEDVRGAVRTIERRSQHLLHFVGAYRSLTRIPRPDLQILPVAELFEGVTGLMRPQVEKRGARFSWTVTPERLEVAADPELVEQVLINLIKNAAEAVEGRPEAEIRLTASLDERGRTLLQVTDNGPGIVEEALDKVFIPFFTTKKEGSGIGLSLSRQIMRQHGGTLSAHSIPDVETVFTLRF